MASSHIGPAAARELRSSVRTATRRSRLGADARDRAESVVWEAALNAAEHGRAPVQVSFSERGSALMICVLDTGPGPGLEQGIASSGDGAGLQSRGRGLALIRGLTDGLLAASTDGGWWRMDLLIVDRDGSDDQP